MSANNTSRPARTGRRRLCLAGALIVAGSLPACTGDNIFTSSFVTGGVLGPQVEITAPQANFTLALGDSVEVTANVSSPEGITTVKFSGTFAGGQLAFTEIVVGSLPSPQDTTMTRMMRQAGTGTGNVRVIVEATDALGEIGADTVNVVIS
jgi:hypothetical protein